VYGGRGRRKDDVRLTFQVSQGYIVRQAKVMAPSRHKSKALICMPNSNCSSVYHIKQLRMRLTVSPEPFFFPFRCGTLGFSRKLYGSADEYNGHIKKTKCYGI
jgi:hypothetical protein